MEKLIMFAMVIAIAAPAVAEDYNVPAFAGGDQTAFAQYEFDVEPPAPTCYHYIPALADPEFFRGAGPYSGTWNEGAATFEPMFRLYGTVPEGIGENITYQLQVTTVNGSGDVVAILNFASAPEEAVQYWESPWHEGGWTNVDLGDETVHYRTVSRENTPNIVLYGLTTEGDGTIRVYR